MKARRPAYVTYILPSPKNVARAEVAIHVACMRQIYAHWYGEYLDVVEFNKVLEADDDEFDRLLVEIAVPDARKQAEGGPS
jgi:hypothetical protein